MTISRSRSPPPMESNSPLTSSPPSPTSSASTEPLPSSLKNSSSKRKKFIGADSKSDGSGSESSLTAQSETDDQDESDVLQVNARSNGITATLDLDVDEGSELSALSESGSDPLDNREDEEEKRIQSTFNNSHSHRRFPIKLGTRESSFDEEPEDVISKSLRVSEEGELSEEELVIEGSEAEIDNSPPDEDEDLDKVESPHLSDKEDDLIDLDQNRKRHEALEDFFKLEIAFAQLRDRSYCERMEEIQREKDAILNGSHPELVKVLAMIEDRRKHRLELAKSELLRLQKETSVHSFSDERSIWSRWEQERADLHRGSLGDNNQKRRRLERDKRFGDRRDDKLTIMYASHIERVAQSRSNGPSIESNLASLRGGTWSKTSTSTTPPGLHEDSVQQDFVDMGLRDPYKSASQYPTYPLPSTSTSLYPTSGANSYYPPAAPSQTSYSTYGRPSTSSNTPPLTAPTHSSYSHMGWNNPATSAPSSLTSHRPLAPSDSLDNVIANQPLSTLSSSDNKVAHLPGHQSRPSLDAHMANTFGSSPGKSRNNFLNSLPNDTHLARSGPLDGGFQFPPAQAQRAV